MEQMALILLCILLYGSATFFKRLGLHYLHPYQFLFIAGICYGIIAPIWYWMICRTVPNAAYPLQGVLWAILYSVFCAGAAAILSFLLRNTNTPGTLIVMTNLSSVITLGLCYFFLHEQLSLTKLIAVGLAIGSLILMNY